MMYQWSACVQMCSHAKAMLNLWSAMADALRSWKWWTTDLRVYRCARMLKLCWIYAESMICYGRCVEKLEMMNQWSACVQMCSHAESMICYGRCFEKLEMMNQWSACVQMCSHAKAMLNLWSAMADALRSWKWWTSDLRVCRCARMLKLCWIHDLPWQMRCTKDLTWNSDVKCICC